MGRQITKLCKICGVTFKYHEGSYLLLAEKGESKPDRCAECRNYHAKIIKELKVPYFTFKDAATYADFNLFPAGYTDHGDRTLPEKVKEDNLSGMDISITEEDVLELYKKLENNQVVVVVSPTGTGKSTYIPKRLLQPANQSGDFVERLIRQGQIIITQPRILATKRVPDTIARISGSDLGPGQAVGYRYSGEDNSDRWNQIIVVTDGTLPNWIREGRLGQYSLIMVDEAHERSCNIDLILGFLKRELPKYPHLRVIISSATINSDAFLDTFKKANIAVDLLSIPSRKHLKKYEHWWKEEKPVEGCDCWLCRQPSEARKKFWENQKDAIGEYDLPAVTANFALKILQETKEGSILIFLHGENAIDDAARRIEARCKLTVPVIRTYRRIQAEAEKRLKTTEEKRRVIVATNIAETSLTIPDLVYVINSGWIKQTEYDSLSGVTKLRAKLHSQDGNTQRAGRVARNRDGYVYNLFTKHQFDNEIEKHTTPEVARSCLEDVLVNIKATGIKNIEQFPWVDTSEKSVTEAITKESVRAEQTLRVRGILDENGDIVEKALDFMHIRRSSSDAALLYLADEQGVLFEVMSALLLMATRDGEARTGAALYNPYNGLLRWDERWTAKTKATVEAVHQGLRMGCQDDLDFVIKLAYCFDTTNKIGLAEKWAKWHFINYEVMREIFKDINELIKRFGEEREESIRVVSFRVLEKVRSLLTGAWKDKVIRLIPGEPVTYQVNGEIAAVSQHCVGYRNKKEALCGTTVEDKVIINGYPVCCPVASFLVRLPGRQHVQNMNSFFADQVFPIGSIVKVTEEGEKSYIVGLDAVPPRIKVGYKKILDDYEEPIPEEEIVSFDVGIRNEFERISGRPRGIRVNEQKSKLAKVTGWTEHDGVPAATFNAYPGQPVLSLGKKKGDKLKVKIHKVALDPGGKSGWVLAKTSSGLDIPIEPSRMSISLSGPGLEQIEGKTLDLTIEDISSEGDPQLSNLDKITEDLRSLREQVAAGTEINIKGYIKKIREEEERVVVIVPRTFGVVHSFEVHQDFVPGKQITNLRVGEEVVTKLSLPSTSADHTRGDYLLQKEITTAPDFLKYNAEKDEINFPYCLTEEQLCEWPARPEVVDFVRRHSWQYCLNARLVNTVSYREALSKLNVSARIVGKVQEETRNREGKSSGLNLNIQVNTSHGPFLLIGFLPLSELSWHRINSPFDIVSIDQELTCRILQIDTNTFPPTLVLSRKQAFIARAQIPYSKVGLLIGTGGNTIRSIIGASDVSIDTKNIPGSVMVYAASQSARDAVCRKISDKIWGMGDWEKHN